MATRNYELSPFDQIAPRSHVDILLCFPFLDKTLRGQVVEQVKNGLLLTFRRWPHLAGRLCKSDHAVLNGLKLEVRVRNSK
jgi:hypothetical protein